MRSISRSHISTLILDLINEYFFNKSFISVALMAYSSTSRATTVESFQMHRLNSQASSKTSQVEINKIDDQLIQIRQ